MSDIASVSVTLPRRPRLVLSCLVWTYISTTSQQEDDTTERRLTATTFTRFTDTFRTGLIAEDQVHSDGGALNTPLI